MSRNKNTANESNTGVDRMLSRHMSWKSTRRFTGLKLIRFS